MKAPDKIYLERILCSNEVYDNWKPQKSISDDIEYTRTDAFIEKACNLLNRMIWEVTYEDLEGDCTQHYDKMEFIEDFRKYLEE